MKTLILNKKRIKTAAAAILCCLVLTSCWEDFDEKLTGTSETAPEVKMASNCTLTTTEAALEWVEPDAVAYKGMKITCTGNGATTETTVNRGTTSYTITGLVSSEEYTITLTALYSTGYSLECSKFSVKPMAKTMRFIYTAADLNDVRNGLSDYCILMADIDLSGYSSGTGWNPIGANSSGNAFTGIFDGNGHTIRNLAINDSANDYKGLFGYTDNASIKNLTLKDVSINGNDYVGALAGDCITGGTISNCSAAGTVIGDDLNVGGLVGHKRLGTLKDSHASVNVSNNSSSAGGLIGFSDTVSITNCYATGSVRGVKNVGGLVGYFYYASITNCYATGDVIINTFLTSDAHAGGLVGLAALPSSGQVIEKCYALGDVTVHFPGMNYTVWAGSLVGTIYVTATGAKVTNCFARGNVDARITSTGSSATLYAGGLIGQSMGNGTIEYCYNTGTFFAENLGSGPQYINGFANFSSGTITACYYNTDTTGRTDSAIGYTPRTTTLMKDLVNYSTNYSGWNFSTVWSISGTINSGYPYLTGMAP